MAPADVQTVGGTLIGAEAACRIEHRVSNRCWISATRWFLNRCEPEADMKPPRGSHIILINDLCGSDIEMAASRFAPDGGSRPLGDCGLLNKCIKMRSRPPCEGVD